MPGPRLGLCGCEEPTPLACGEWGLLDEWGVGTVRPQVTASPSGWSADLVVRAGVQRGSWASGPACES